MKLRLERLQKATKRKGLDATHDAKKKLGESLLPMTLSSMPKFENIQSPTPLKELMPTPPMISPTRSSDTSQPPRPTIIA